MSYASRKLKLIFFNASVLSACLFSPYLLKTQPCPHVFVDALLFCGLLKAKYYIGCVAYDEQYIQGCVVCVGLSH